MKAEILALLREQGSYVSGQELCERFGVSRTAVWKAINQLKKEGYQISAVQNKGYLLEQEEEIFGQNELESRMDTAWAGHPVSFYAQINSTNLQAKLDAVNAQVRTAEALIVSPDTAILEAEKAKAEAALSRLKTEAMMRAAQARNGWEAGRRERADEVQARMEALESGPDESGSLAAQIAAKKSEQEALRQEWNEANSVKPPFEKSCPTCGRPYDNQEAIQASLAAFNLDKARRLEAITAKGSRLGAEISELTVRLDAEMEKAREMQRQRAALRAELAAIRAEPTPDFRPDMPAEAAALESDISSIDAQIAEAKAGTAQGNAAIQSRIDAMKAEARAIMAQIAQSDHNGRAEARIAELMEEQKSLAQELEALENLQYLAEEFTRAKVEMIQEKINGQFTLARFKLFDEQINGGLTDACLCRPEPCDADQRGPGYYPNPWKVLRRVGPCHRG